MTFNDAYWIISSTNIPSRERKEYMLSILNSLAEYFNQMNRHLPKPEKVEIQKGEKLYILFDGNKPVIYLTWEDIMIEKIDAKGRGEYESINETSFCIFEC